MYFFFYYPIGAETEEEGTPWATWILSACMLALTLYYHHFAVQAMLQWRWWTYFPQAGITPGLLFSIFNHNNMMHLGGNLLYLWVFGPGLERVLGSGRYALLFLFLGVFGNLGQALFSRFIMPELAGYGIVGASGAISGLLGLFLLRFPSCRIKTVWLIFSPLHGLARSGIVRIPSYLAIGSWIALQALAASSALLGSSDMTAYGAHLGGLAGGMLLAVGLGLHRQGRFYRWRYEARRRFERGNYLGAYEAIQPLLESDDAEDLTMAARCNRLIGQKGPALKLYRRAIERGLEAQDSAGAAACYAEALRFFPQLGFDEKRQFRLIGAMEQLGLEAGALQAISHYRETFKDSPRLGLLLLKAARLETPHDPDRARRLYEEHLERFPGSPMEGLAQEALRQLSEA